MQVTDNNSENYVPQHRGIKTLATRQAAGGQAVRKAPVPEVAQAVMRGLPAELGEAVQQELADPHGGVRVPERMPKEHGLAPAASSPSPAHVAIAVEDLPSQGAFYHQVSHIHVRRFNLAEIREIGRSRALKSSRLLVSAVGRTIDFPVMNLTEGDYHYILHWHRLNSFKKMRGSIEFNCTDHAHLLAVNDKKAAIETIRNIDTNPRHVSLTPIKLDVQKLEPLLEEFHEMYGIYPYIERMEDIIEAGELDEAISDDLGMYLDYAAYLSPEIVAAQIEADPSLASKRLVLRAEYLRANEENFDGDFVHMLNTIKEAMEHGVEHRVRVTCAYCTAHELGGASAERLLQLDAASFLP